MRRDVGKVLGWLLLLSGVARAQAPLGPVAPETLQATGAGRRGPARSCPDLRGSHPWIVTSHHDAGHGPIGPHPAPSAR